MKTPSKRKIKNEIADSAIIFHRGNDIYEKGELLFKGRDNKKSELEFGYDGNYGDYTQVLSYKNGSLSWFSCDCPYPGNGCKHIVAAFLTTIDMEFSRLMDERSLPPDDKEIPVNFTYDEIREQALEDREKRAKKEEFEVVLGDMYKGEHLIITLTKKQYSVVIHKPETGEGHCNCPDFISNKLNTCKHLIFLKKYFSKKKGFDKQVKKEKFPYVDIYWDTIKSLPVLYYEKEAITDLDTISILDEYFDLNGNYSKDFSQFVDFMNLTSENKKIVIQPEVIKRLQLILQNKQLEKLKRDFKYDFSSINANLYDYQKEGVEFGVLKKSILIGDEMGLGKTIQAITISVMKKEIFGFKKVLIVTLASLKDQWKREIDRFTNETSVVIEGTAIQRKNIYRNNTDYFKITNYEAVLRDVTIITEMKPDIIILDEAQRIKNFNTKTADAVKNLKRDHAMVLTGTPLENKLEDIYSIIQFLDPYLINPLWDFAGKYFIIPRDAKGKKIGGYKNLKKLKERLSQIVIRRRKEEVLDNLPETVTNNYYIDLSDQQEKLHAGYMSALIPILTKKFLTPLDIQRIQMFLLKMRMVCNSTYLVDKKTNISPKLKEFESIIHDLVIENGRKVVVFSEWTTMTFLVAKLLSAANIQFIELSGKVPVKKRQKLIDEFTNNPMCKVFLSTDAGGTGLNLQAADCVINCELPWNPAKLNQRTGRVNRIGQKSGCINVVNLIAKRSIEEKILSGLQMKTDLFKGVFEDGSDVVDFSNEKKTSLINKLREMMGDEPDKTTKPEPKKSIEIPEDTPGYLNPEVLKEDVIDNDVIDNDVIDNDVIDNDIVGEKKAGPTKTVDYAGEEDTLLHSEEKTIEEKVTKADELIDDAIEISENVFKGQPNRKIETVLNSGMEFIGGLLEMATGKKIKQSSTQDKMLKIDKTTGEVTMKFKLPGF